MTANEIRQTFLNYFASKGHQILPSAPMVIKNDPTLMFVNAGMNPFKDVFMGNQAAKHPRIADSQKCLRVSGKHNDLEEVGRDTYHHTMFEMLGNWSFGDYFKVEAIQYAWELLTKVYGINAEDLYVTVYGGDPADGLGPDSEAYELWRAILPEERILFGSKKDNFWEMGDTGPCGPCSEIHADIRSAQDKQTIAGRDLVNKDHPQVIEIWNLVFMQYNRLSDGRLQELPAKHVDTGMGFERLCMLIQGTQSNYDTDVFQPLIKAIAQMASITYGQETDKDIAIRVISDHIRAVGFAIADGQLPSNNKAGYVIRRILRRAVRYGYTFLGFNEPFLCRLFPVLVEQMGHHFPELKRQESLITRVIQEEEAAFLRTLESGIRLIDQHMAQARQKGLKQISGADAFVAYDTFGFPIDLTELILREHGFEIDMSGFEKELQAQKERSRSAATVDTDDWVELRQGAQTTFIGYDFLESDVEILRYRKVSTKQKTYYQVVLNQTPFYGEMGGQIGDRGTLVDCEGRVTPIFDTQKENDLIVHLCMNLPQDPHGGFVAQVDREARRAIEANHTATHLMHAALREVLGLHVEQKGSLVRVDNLRFDFAHFQKLTNEEIRRVEILVNQWIREDYMSEEHREIPIEKAQAMGAMALFGEKYGDKVRVLKYGSSIELCGGTHVERTGQIGVFKIVNESAIAAGIRRIEAITAHAAELYFYDLVDSLKVMQALFKSSPNVIQAVQKTVEENDVMRKRLDAFMQERAEQIRMNMLQSAIETDRYLYIEHSGLSPELFKTISVRLRKEYPNLIFISTGKTDEGVMLSLALGDTIVAEGYNASNIIKEVMSLIDGSGGGQAFSATARGKNETRLFEALERIKQSLNL